MNIEIGTAEAVVGLLLQAIIIIEAQDIEAHHLANLSTSVIIILMY